MLISIVLQPTNMRINCSRKFKTLLLCCIVSICNLQDTLGQSDVTFDIVLNGGRVIDPDTKLDALRNVGILKGRIAEISTNKLVGHKIIDATGLIVAPGFIDLHVHGISNKEQEYQLHDGVTTALELEVGVPFAKDWYASRESKALINYGSSVSWPYKRAEVMEGHKTRLVQLGKEIKEHGWDQKKIASSLAMPSNYTALPSANMTAMLKNIKSALDDGALGIAVPIGYLPGATLEEVFRVYQLAGELQVPIISHVRNGGTISIQQAISDAVLTNAPLHIVHVNSMALSEIELAIEMVATAQKRGFNITTEMYPYTAGSTSLESAVFDEGWQERLGIGYQDLQWVETGERLTEKTFGLYREQGGTVILHLMKPEWIKAGIRTEGTIIASDGMPYAKLAHPRTAGTFARVLGKYVREDKVLNLPIALEKMTFLPAKMLERVAPMMRFKGRVQVGADADITIFDPEHIRDKATFENGLDYSEGIRFVLINGTLVLEEGDILENVYPGQPIIGRYKK